MGKLPPVVQITQNITGAGKSLPAEFHLHRTTLLPYGIVSPLWYCAIPGKSVLLWNSAVGLLLEANHDINMLQTGAYPYPLKRRIMGDSGHLSNERSGQLLCELLHDKFGSVILGHLSKENNYEKLAYEAVRLEVTMGDNPYKASDFPMYVAKRDRASDRIAVE